ncbi:MAG: enoyl-CoA hydratase/isomerase family protein [Calothrix sp. SM1_5_4]|nr:enoyl-CoA hydratase/isomerase family protein [Calothrix sp. SM1_5_4]
MSYFELRDCSSYLELHFSAPDSANALSLSAARELAAIASKHRAYPGVVVVRARGPVFCSGGHLTDYAKLKGKAPGLRVNREITRALDRFAQWPCVKLAAIEGDVLGGGMEWLARFDYRWSVPHAVFGFWQRRIGLTFGWGGGAVWARHLGEPRTRQLLMESRPLSAAEALRLGLLDRIVPGWKLADELAAWAAAMDGAGPARRWTASAETRIFSSLWLGETHRRVLAKWRK